MSDRGSRATFPTRPEELAGSEVVVDPAADRSSSGRMPLRVGRPSAQDSVLSFGSPPRSLRAAAVLLAVLAASTLLATFVVAFWLWRGELVATPPAVVFFCLFALLPISIVSLLWAAARAVWHGRSWGLSLAAGICVLSVIGAGFLAVDFGYRWVVGLTIDAASWWLLLVVGAVMLLGSVAAMLLRRLRYTPFVLAGGMHGLGTGTIPTEPRR